MRKILGIILASHLSLAVAQQTDAVGPASEEVKAKLEIEELEKRWLAAANEPEALKVILADDFVLVSPGGPISKEQWIAHVKKQRGPSSGESRRFDDLQVRIYGEIAIVNGMKAGTNLSRNTTEKTIFTENCNEFTGLPVTLHRQENCRCKAEKDTDRLRCEISGQVENQA